jgi:hypothetical protein
MAQTKRRPESNLDGAEIEEARRVFADGGIVRVASAGRVFLCSTLDEVAAAQRGRVTPGAVRLDGAR